MTKKLLLSAAAVAVMAFAGAANAGQLTTGSKIALQAIVSGTPEKVDPYIVAKDFAFPAAGMRTNNTLVDQLDGEGEVVLAADSDRTIFVFKNTTNPISIATNTDYIVTLTLSGPAKFINQGATIVTLGATEVATSETPILSADGKTLTIYSKTPIEIANSPILDTVSVSGFNIHVTAQEAVSVAYKLQQVVGSQTLDLDTSTAAEVIQFKNSLSVYNQGDAVDAKAKLPDFVTFVDGDDLVSDSFESDIAGYKTSLTGSSVTDVNLAILGYTATITGPQVEDLLVHFNGASIDDASDVTATSATFTKTSGGGNFTAALSAVEDLEIAPGTYSVAIKPRYATNWSGPVTVYRDLFVISLDGTNFSAPWFALQAPGANSTLRLANNGTAEIGPIVISLKANNGTVAQTGTYTIDSVAPGKFVSVTGGVLKAAFGTDAANGDLQITIQSQSNSVSAKVRTTQTNGQIFENSLNNLPEVN